MKPADPIVFIIDDDPGVLRTLELMGASHGLHTVGFDTAERFLDRFDPPRAGCVVVDLHLPGMSGIELIERLSNTGPPLAAIAISGAATVEDAVRSMRAGAVDLLIKPIKPEVFVRALDRAIEASARKREDHLRRVRRQRSPVMVNRRESSP